MPKSNHAIPLAEIHPGEEVVVREFRSGRAVGSRLASLGFTPGTLCSTNRIESMFDIVRTIQPTDPERSV